MGLSKLQGRMLLAHFREAYESKTFVSYNSLENIVKESTTTYRHLLCNILSTLKKECGYDFIFQKKPQKGYKPVTKEVKNELETSFKCTISLVDSLRNSYQENTFLDNKAIYSIVKDASKYEYILRNALRIIKRDYGYRFEITEKGCLPITKKSNVKSNYTRIVIAYCKEAYESKCLAEYQAMNKLVPHLTTQRRYHLESALFILKKDYGYAFTNVEGKGYYPITKNFTKCDHCECQKNLRIKWIPKVGLIAFCQECYIKYLIEQDKKRNQQRKNNSKNINRKAPSLFKYLIPVKSV